MNKQQMQDREQFRRYAEAAMSGLISNRKDFEGDHYMARRSFEIATAMMIGESQAFHQYQLKALEAIVDDERIRHEGK
jgi:hypothetical protein